MTKFTSGIADYRATPTLNATIQTAAFTAAWGSAYHVNATSGSLTIDIPTAVGNADNRIEITRSDASANTVTLRTANGQVFSNLVAGNNSNTCTVAGRSTVTLESNGTNPIARDANGIAAASRLWLPSDLTGGTPLFWWNFRNAASLTLNGSTVQTIANLGTAGTGYNLTQATAANQPTINDTANPLYADFSGDWMGTSAVQDSLINGTNFTIAALYSADGARSTSLFAQIPATSGGQVNYHPKWSDNNTYLDLPITSARISGNLGTAAANGATNPITMVGRRGGANMELYLSGNQTASLSSAAVSGTSSGTGTLFIGRTASSGTETMVGRIYEMIAFRAQCTTDERDRLAAYMAWGAGTQSILHTSNPYRLTPPTVAL